MSFGKSSESDTISYLSKQAIDELSSIQEQDGLAKEAAAGKHIAQKLHCHDKDDITFAIRMMEEDIASLRAKPEFLVFESMLSVIAIIVAIAAVIPSFQSALSNDHSSASTYIWLAVAIAVFGLCYYFRAYTSWLGLVSETILLDNLKRRKNVSLRSISSVKMVPKRS